MKYDAATENCLYLEVRQTQRLSQKFWRHMRIGLQVFILVLSQAWIFPAQAEETSVVDRLPSFSWARVPRYMHIRKETAFTPEELRYLASFPLITFEKGTGGKDCGSTEVATLAAARAVKALNPAAKVLYYRNVLVHYDGYAANAGLTNIANAFLVGRDNNDKLVRGRVQAYDLTNPNVREWWVANAKQVCADPAIDGLFLDGNVKVLEPSYLLGEIGKAKKEGVLEGYSAMVEATRRALGPNKLMLANVLRARFADSGKSRLRAFDGCYIEAFETTVGKIPVEDYVAKGIAAFQEAARDGYVIAFTAGLGEESGDEGKANEARTDEIRTALKKKDAYDRRFQYLLALFLICAEKHSYFCAHDGYDVKNSREWRRARPEFERRLGAPKGPAVRKGYTYAREFEHASVFVDIEQENARIDWK